MESPTTSLLGGDLSPIAWCVQYLRAPMEVVLGELVEIHTSNRTPKVTRLPFPDVARALTPFQAPWTRDAVIACGDEWTAYLNNGLNGGDPTAVGPALAVKLGVDCVVAVNTPRFGPGHQQTSIEISGPAGEPPLMGIRSLTADCADGRWSWHTYGNPLAFEDQSR